MIPKSNSKQIFSQKVKELKQEVENEEQGKSIEKTEALNQLATVKANEELSQLYKENAEVGTANLSNMLPILKVHSAGRSNKNELNNGEEPTDGSFFYTPTKEQFTEVESHILTISQGYYDEGMEEGKKVFTQILGGVIINDDMELPFFMYFRGLRLSNLWAFGKEASPYSKARPFPIPLFTLKVKLTTEKVKNKFGSSWIIKFQILRDVQGYPLVVTDTEYFKRLRNAVDKAEETISSLIETRTKTQEVVEEENLVVGTEYDTESKGKEDVDPDTIPF